MFHGTGSRITKKAIQKYGIENFKFAIQEYYPGIILKENIKKQHLKLLEREDYYIKKYLPIYNISSITPHKDDTKNNERMSIYSLYKNDPGQKERISKLNSKPVVLLDDKLNVIKEFKGVRSLSKYLGCCHKTVNKAIKKEKILKGYYIRYKTK